MFKLFLLILYGILDAKITYDQYLGLKVEIAALISKHNCGPLFVRLAWHDAGTYDSKTNTGGPRAAMRFDDGESKHDANNGLEIARKLLLPLQKKYCDKNIISIADLWAFAGNTAIEVTKGPNIPFKFGRIDAKDSSECVEDGRLPDAKQGISHIRSVINRIMGNNDDKYVVALSGAHTLGKCHNDRSGFDGKWTKKPNLFDNSYFKDLLNKKWDVSISEAGNTQFISNDDTIMLPSDWTLIRNDNTRKYVELYAKDKKAFFNDFSDAWQRLIQSGYNNDVLYEVIPDKDDL